MSNDLTELHERVEHCRTEWCTLRDEISAFIKASIKIIEPALGIGGVQAKQLHNIPTSIRSRSGAIVNELRSCLDALACRLAERNGEYDLSGVYFPAAKDETTYPAERKKKLKKLSQPDQDKISALQPYGGGHPLIFLMHEADRVRKHQRLLAFSGSGHISPAGSGFVGLMINEPNVLEVGKTVNIGMFQNVTSGVHVSFKLCYGEPEILKGQDVLYMLYHFIQSTDSIISTFD